MIARRQGGLVLAGIFWLAMGGVSQATDYTVMNTADTGTGSLRQAVEDANANSGSDRVLFDGGVSGTITLTSAVISIYDPLEIIGPGAETLTISGNNLLQILTINNVPDPGVSISGLRLTAGRNAAAGGALNNFNSDLAVSDCVFDHNATELWGGAIESFQGSLTVSNSSFTENTADHEFGGAAIHVGDGADTAVTIDASTISGNTEIENGGGLSLGADKNKISNSTISGNFAGGTGGGLTTGGHLKVKSSTIANNQAAKGGGIFKESGASAKLQNTIVADNHADKGRDLTKGLFKASYSLIENKKGAKVKGKHNIFGRDPRLLDLMDNGGPTETLALSADSPAIKKASKTTSLSTDQRGYDRDNKPDIGAFEFGASP